MPRATLHHVAELLPVSGEARVVKPHWLNPAVEGGGAGLEFRTEQTVEGLLTEHRERLITCAYAAQFLVVRCARGGGPAGIPGTHKPLGSNRPETDMFWHTDTVQREGIVTAVIGRSPERTGIASKPLVAQAVADRRPVRDELYRLKNTHKALSLYEEERMGRSLLSRDAVSQHLGDVHEDVTSPQIGYALQRIVDQFWEHIRTVNAQCDALWFGEPDDDADHELAIVLSQNVYHCKEYTPRHYYSRDGDKLRIDLPISDEQKRAIISRFKHLVHGEPDPVEFEWLRKPVA